MLRGGSRYLEIQRKGIGISLKLLAQFLLNLIFKSVHEV